MLAEDPQRNPAMQDNILEIKVSSKTHCNDLAGSIAAAWNEGRGVVLSAIGPVPVSQAYKAVCVANRSLASRGVMLVIIPGLVMKDMPDLEKPGQTVQWVVAKMRLRDLLVSPARQEDAPSGQDVQGIGEDVRVVQEKTG